MRIFLSYAMIMVLLFVASVRARSPKPGLNPVAKAILWQARQYTHINTIHFKAVLHDMVTMRTGKIESSIERYEYWGAGEKYRIDYQHFTPRVDIDYLVTDNGRHHRAFDRIADILAIGPTHPVQGVTPVIENPILEPLAPLAHHFPRRLKTPHIHWVNLARFARNPNSIFDRCRQVRNCGKKGPRGCILGAYEGKPAHVRFTISGGASHPLVSGWRANEFRSGSYIRLSRIRYQAFRLKSGRKIFLPVEYVEKGMIRNLPIPISGPFTTKVFISHVSIDKPIPPGKFTINYKLAGLIIDETHGKYKYIAVQPTQPALPRTHILK